MTISEQIIEKVQVLSPDEQKRLLAQLSSAPALQQAVENGGADAGIVF